MCASFTRTFSFIICKHAGILTENLHNEQSRLRAKLGQDRKTMLEVFHTWSTLGKYWMRKPRRIPATIPPATSSTPLRRLYQVEPGAKHTPTLEVINRNLMLLGRHGEHHSCTLVTEAPT